MRGWKPRVPLLPNNASIRPIVSPTLHDLCAGVPIPKFASLCSTLSCELRNQRDTSKLTHSSVVLDLKFLGEFAAYCRNFKSTTLAGNGGNDIVSAAGTEGGRVESNRMSQVSRLISFVVLFLLALAVPARAQTYPERVVRIVNPYPPGGSVDVMARILAQKLTDNLGQQVIVENRSGGGGNTGSDFVAKAEPDGYTLLFTAPGPLTVNQTLYSKLPFDPAKDFAPVALFATAPIVLIVNP